PCGLYGKPREDGLDLSTDVLVFLRPYVQVPPGYVYPSPYLAAAPSGIVPLPPAPLSHAAALAAATSQFYEYQNAAAAAAVTYPGQYPNGFETYPYTSAAGAASYVTPYTYATLPQTAGLPAAAAGGFPGLSPYQTAAQATLQEARMQHEKLYRHTVPAEKIIILPLNAPLPRPTIPKYISRLWYESRPLHLNPSHHLKCGVSKIYSCGVSKIYACGVSKIYACGMRIDAECEECGMRNVESGVRCDLVEKLAIYRNMRVAQKCPVTTSTMVSNFQCATIKIPTFVFGHAKTRCQTQSLAKRRGTTSLTTTAYSPKIFFKIIIATPAVKVYVRKWRIVILFAVELKSLVKMALNMQQQITIAAWAITYANDQPDVWRLDFSLLHMDDAFEQVWQTYYRYALRWPLDVRNARKTPPPLQPSHFCSRNFCQWRLFQSSFVVCERSVYPTAVTMKRHVY
ncbi:hypothetical protein L9F63_016358, partial [Diploptera punctata]